MTTEEYDDLIEDYLNNIKKYMKEAGGLFPHITIFADKKEEEDTNKAIIHIPIPPEYMESDGDKDELIEEVLPVIFKEVNKKFIPYAIGWASEAWMRTASKVDDIKNYKDLPIKKEVLFITIETEDKTQCIFYEIKRVGLKVTSDAELTDEIDLIELKDLRQENNAMGGRFSGLYKKLVK